MLCLTIQNQNCAINSSLTALQSGPIKANAAVNRLQNNMPCSRMQNPIRCGNCSCIPVMNTTLLNAPLRNAESQPLRCIHRGWIKHDALLGDADLASLALQRQTARRPRRRPITTWDDDDRNSSVHTCSNVMHHLPSPEMRRCPSESCGDVAVGGRHSPPPGRLKASHLPLPLLRGALHHSVNLIIPQPGLCFLRERMISIWMP